MVEDAILPVSYTHLDVYKRQEFKRLKAKLIHFYNKYNNSIRVTAIFDKAMISPYKASPIDQGPQVFEKLLAERIIPKG